MFYLGNYPDVDPNESNYDSENANDLVGVSANKSTGLELVTITNYDASDDGTINDNDYDTSSGETATYAVGGGAPATRNADSSIEGTAKVTLGDGTVITANVVILQMDNGDVFVTNLINNNSLDNKNIDAIEIATITGTNFSGYYASQTTTNANVVCFAAGTMIRTPSGDVPVERLAQGDMVCTADNGAQPIRWIGARKVDSIDLAANPKLRPVHIRAGSLGGGLPTSDLLVSRQHRMLLSSQKMRTVCDKDEALVAAIRLTETSPHIFVDLDVEEVDYFHILFDQHQIIYANDAPSESLYTGKQALLALDRDAYDEIISLFPELSEPNHKPVSARYIPPNKMQKQISRVSLEMRN